MTTKETDPLPQTTLDKNCVVISQPMYFPWVGMLEQIRLCDTFVHYEDVQFTRGSFSNRVQVKTEAGMRWLSVPLKNHKLGQLINEVEIDYRSNWQKNHCETLKHAYAKASCKVDMLELIEEVFSYQHKTIAELSKASMMSLVNYFDLNHDHTFLNSPELNINGSSTQRVIDICAQLKASLYLTGHGAKNYLDHGAFESIGVDVAYIGYGLVQYKQLHGSYTPYVTALDLIANCGKIGIEHIKGEPIPWREFIESKKEI